jgi:hypothetical protein
MPFFCTFAAQLLHVATDQNMELSTRFPLVCGSLAACATRPDRHIRDRLRIAGALQNTAITTHSGDVLRVTVPLMVQALSFDALAGLASVIAGHTRATEARMRVFAARAAASSEAATETDTSALEGSADDALAAAKEGHSAWSAHVSAMKVALEMITNACTSDADTKDTSAGKAMHAAIVDAGLVAMVRCPFC